MKLNTLKKASILFCAVVFFCISPIQFTNASWDELNPSQFEEFPDEDEGGGSSSIERQLCYTLEALKCSETIAASGGINAQVNPAPGGGVNGNYTKTVTYSYNCKRGIGGNRSECQPQSCNGSWGVFVRCPKK